MYPFPTRTSQDRSACDKMLLSRDVRLWIADHRRKHASSFCVIGVTLVSLLLTQLPLMKASVGTPRSMTFAGSLGSHHDTNGNLAEIRQGTKGEWLYQDRYASEPHGGVLPFPFNISLGKKAGVLRLSPQAMFTLARAVCLRQRKTRQTAAQGQMTWPLSPISDRPAVDQRENLQSWSTTGPKWQRYFYILSL
jgi:hypothetical protein